MTDLIAYFGGCDNTCPVCGGAAVQTSESRKAEYFSCYNCGIDWVEAKIRFTRKPRVNVPDDIPF